MTKRIAVITDATSAEFWFPKWHKYYATEFGADALHVVTYRGHRTDFRSFDLAAVWDVAQTYDDKLRANLISSLVGALLVTHDVVVRCDVDEFLIPDLRKYTGLRDYVTRCDMPYVSAYGIDVFEKEGDGTLDMSLPILVSQRQYGIVNTPLHKISVTTKPLHWGPGFHSATVPPAFDSLFMFHMKFADVERRSAWFQFMQSSVSEGGPEHKYFASTREQMQGHKASFSRRPCLPDGWPQLLDEVDRHAFLSSVTRKNSGNFLGAFTISTSSFVIPDEFRDRV